MDTSCEDTGITVFLVVCAEDEVPRTCFTTHVLHIKS